MEINIFMDETSRTGRQKYNSGKWNFNDKPFFSLGALYIPSINVENLYNELQTIIIKENFQGEFKWSNKSAQSRINRLIPIFMDIITRNNAKMFFEIEDKRFTIAKIFTEYCIFPYYETDEIISSDIDFLCSKRAFASFVADNLTDESLWNICSFFDSGEHDTRKLKMLIRKIINEINNELIKRACLITIDSIEQVEKGNSPLSRSNLFPVKDSIKHNGIISTLTIDPHTDCFSDLICKANYFFPDCKSISCIHDEQNQWYPAFIEAIERIKSNRVDYSISFTTKSGYDGIINTVDYFSGYLNLCINQLFSQGKSIPECLQKLCNSNLSLVSSVTLQCKLWKDDPEIAITKDIYEEISKYGLSNK